MEALEVSRHWERGAEQHNLYYRGMALLAAGRAEDAEREFTRASELPQLDFFSVQGRLPLLGLARARVELGKIEEARAAYEAFFEAYQHADPGLPIVEKARSEYEALPGARG